MWLLNKLVNEPHICLPKAGTKLLDTFGFCIEKGNSSIRPVLYPKLPLLSPINVPAVELPISHHLNSTFPQVEHKTNKSNTCEFIPNKQFDEHEEWISLPWASKHSFDYFILDGFRNKILREQDGIY